MTIEVSLPPAAAAAAAGLKPIEGTPGEDSELLIESGFPCIVVIIAAVIVLLLVVTVAVLIELSVGNAAFTTRSTKKRNVCEEERAI